MGGIQNFQSSITNLDNISDRIFNLYNILGGQVVKNVVILDGMTAMLDRIPRDKKRTEYLIKTAKKVKRAREKEIKAREKVAKKKEVATGK